MAFLIEVAKVTVILIATIIVTAVLYLVWTIAREVGWLIKQENRKQYAEKQEAKKDNENNSI